MVHSHFQKACLHLYCKTLTKYRKLKKNKGIIEKNLLVQ